jgi:hypothetical protein
MPTPRTKPVIFISYAHADEPEKPAEGEVRWLSFVERYLRPAQRRGAVEIWTDRLMRGGDPWDPEIKRKLNECDIFVVLVSHNSLSSDYVIGKEIAIIRRRQKNGEDVHLYPLLLTPTPEIALKIVGDRNLRPRDGKPFSEYPFNARLRHMSAAADEIAAIAKEIAARKNKMARLALERQDKIERSVAGRANAKDRQGARAITVQAEVRAAPDSLPSDPHMIGRTDQQKELVGFILNEDRPVIVLGEPGIGKTTLALAATYDPLVVERFGARRYFVPLDAVRDADGVVAQLAFELGLPATGAAAEIETAIRASCLVQPALVVLDNFETPFGKDSRGSETRLARLAGMTGLRLVLTMRGRPPHMGGKGARNLTDIPLLTEEEARTLFLRHAGDQFHHDPALPKLIAALDNHPLSIELLAANAAGKTSLQSLFEDWTARRADLLQAGSADDRLTSLRVSLGLSLDALGASSAAHRLIRAMALLPDGMSDTDSKTILSDEEPTGDERAAALRLETARLARRADGRWRLLAPVRETLRRWYPPEPGDEFRVLRRFLEYAKLGMKIGTHEWKSAKERLLEEAGNLDEMAHSSLSKPTLIADLPPAIEGLAKFHCATGRASTASVQAFADKSVAEGDTRNAALSYELLGDMALARTDRGGASFFFKTALDYYKQRHDLRGEAVCAERRGRIAYDENNLDDAAEGFENARKIFEEIRETAAEGGCFERLADVAIRRAQFHAARTSLAKGLRLFRLASYKPGEAGCLLRLGDVANREFSFKEANDRFSQASEIFADIDDVRGQAGCAERLGDVSLRRFNLDEAKKHYIQAYIFYRQIRDIPGKAGVLQRLGDQALCSWELQSWEDKAPTEKSREPPKSFSYNPALRLARARFYQAELLYLSIQNEGGRAGCVLRKGKVALAKGYLADAKAFFGEALNTFKRIRDQRGEATCLEGLAMVEADSNVDRARVRYSEAERLFASVGDLLGQANCFRGLGDTHEAKGETKAAGERWRDALALYLRIQEPWSIGLTRLRLARRAEAPEEAAKHREAAREAWASIGRKDRIDQFLGG